MSRRKKNANIHPFDDDRERHQSDYERPRKRRRLPVVFLLLVLILFFLPNLLGLTGLHQRAFDYALSDFQGKVTVEKVSLGWLQSVSLANVSAVDQDGNDLFKIEQVTTSKPLFSLLGMNDLGQVEIRKPMIFLHLHPGGSNLEDALAAYMMPKENGLPGGAQPAPSSPLPKAIANVTDGRAIVTSATDSQTWQLDGVEAVVQTSTDSAPLVVDAECRVMPLQVDDAGEIKLQQPGQLKLNALIDPESNHLRFGSMNVALSTSDFPVSITGPVLQRFVGPAQAAGLMSGDLQSRINLSQPEINVDVKNLVLNDFGFAAPQLLGSDIVQLKKLNANGTLEVSSQVISSQNFQLSSDFGRVNANGRFDVKELTEMASGGRLVGTPFQMDGQIDLAGLVRMLPSTLQLHRDLQIQSGTIQFQAATNQEQGVPRLVMNLDAANLKARRGGQNIVWQNPLRLVGTIRQSAAGLELEDLLCESDFLDIAGSANMQTAAFRTQGDLSKLMNRVGQFVDLNGTQLAGKIDGSFGWQTAEQSGSSLASKPIQIGGTFVVENPVIQFPGMPVWQQPRLSVKLSAAGQSSVGQTESQNVLHLEQGGLQIEVGSERAVASLAAPLQNAYVEPWNLNCQLTGDLNGWLRHLQNFVDVGNIQLAGQADMTFAAILESNLLRLNNINYEFQQFAFDGYGTKIREPKVTGTGTAAYNLSTGQLAVADTLLTANSIAARGQNLMISYAGNLRVDGNVAFRGDINRMADWWNLSPSDDSIFWFGNAEGNLQLASNESGIGTRLNSTITDLVAAQRVAPGRAAPGIVPVGNQTNWQELFREPKLDLNSDLTLGGDFNSVQFAKLLINSSAIRVAGAGSITELATIMLTDLSGSWNPDWQKINALLAAYTGNFVQLSGSGEQPFAIRGPVFASAATNPSQPQPWISPALQARTSFRWDRGSVLDVPIGASQFDFDLQNSFATIKTSGIPISGGMVKFGPTIDMRGENPVLTIDQDRIVDNLTLSPETARQWLKFVAPLAADATSAQGRVTIDAQTVRVPLFSPVDVEARGAIHLADVVIGAGPLADQLINAVSMVRSILEPGSNNGRDLKTWLQMSQQTIPIAVQNRRVYHENLSFTYKDTVVKTRGSVGFDQSLNLVAEIPIADDWIQGKSYLAGLRGQSISIPIGGTVSKPKLDQRAIQQLSTQLVRNAAGNAINQAIGDKVTPKINEYQNQFNNQINNELNKFQGKIGEALGGSLLPQGTAPTPANNGAAPVNGGSQPNLGQQLEGELLKGIGNLFGGGK